MQVIRLSDAGVTHHTSSHGLSGVVMLASFHRGKTGGIIEKGVESDVWRAGLTSLQRFTALAHSVSA